MMYDNHDNSRLKLLSYYGTELDYLGSGDSDIKKSQIPDNTR